MIKPTKKIDHKFEIPKGYKLVRQEGDAYICTRPDGTCAVLQDNSEESMCHQEYAADADINNLMRKYTYAELPDVPVTVSQFSQVIDYQDMLNASIEVRKAFDMLPGDLRQKFGDNPQNIINFLNDPNNRDEAIKLGLVNPKVEPQVDPVLAELKNISKNTTKKTKIVEVEE